MTHDTHERKTLRKQLRDARAGLSDNDVARASNAAAANFLACPEFRRARHIAGYVAVANEIDPAAIFEAAHAAGKSVYLPCIKSNRRLLFARWGPGARLHAGRYGIPEPEDTAGTIAPAELELVIVPMLGFDALGHRIGNGGGYYDRNFDFRLERGRKIPVLAGYAHSLQACRRIPAEAWDVPLDMVVTEHGVQYFRSDARDNTARPGHAQ